MAKKRSSGVQSVERAIAILKAFSIEQPERGVGELSDELGLHKSTVSRLAQTLQRSGLLTRNPETKRYRLGIELLGLASQVASYLDVREVARPLLRQLAKDCQESVNLVVLEDGQVINLEQFIPAERQVKNIGRVGRRMCAHATSAGKVMLAYLSPGELDQALGNELAGFTSNTITDPRELHQQLAQIRKQGYAVAQEELEDGLNAIAAPIHDHTNHVIAAASIAGPAYRIRPEMFAPLADQLVRMTDRISREMGYHLARQ